MKSSVLFIPADLQTLMTLFVCCFESLDSMKSAARRKVESMDDIKCKYIHYNCYITFINNIIVLMFVCSGQHFGACRN